MKITKLETKEQLEALKRNDLLIVQWVYDPNSGKDFNEITATKIWGIQETGIGTKYPQKEIIVSAKYNLYFCVDGFLQGKSCAKEVYLVTE